MTSKKPSKILITRLSAHGDVIQTLPLLSALKNQANDTKTKPFIGWVVEESAAPLLLSHPLIDRLHISRRKTWLKTLSKKPWQCFKVFKEILDFFHGIKEEQYEASLDVQGLSKSALIPFISRIPRRFGYKDTREQADMYYTDCLPKHELHNPDIPTVLKFREFAEAIDYLKKEENTLDTLKTTDYPLPEPSKQAKQKVETLLKPLNPKWPSIAVAPKTIWPSKHWPESHWQGLLQAMAQWPVNIIVLAAPNEKEAVETLVSGLESSPKQSNIHNFCGETQLPELYELFKHVAIFVGLDSALLHIANAVAFNQANNNPRIIGLYGATSSKRTGPINAPNQLQNSSQHSTLSTEYDCQPCFKRQCPLKTEEQQNQCLTGLSVPRVLEEINKQHEALFSSPISPSVNPNSVLKANPS